MSWFELVNSLVLIFLIRKKDYNDLFISLYIYISMYACEWVYVCMRERERDIDRERERE